MAIFTATFAGVSVGAEQDLFELVASPTKRLSIRRIMLGQYSDFGEAQAEVLSVQLIRGHATAGSGGQPITPTDVGLVTGEMYRTPTVTAARNNTTLASGGSPKVLLADTFNVAAGWWFDPLVDERLMAGLGERLVVRISAPTDALTMNGTIVFEEH